MLLNIVVYIKFIMDIYKIKAKDIFSFNLIPWIGQRGLNMDWVSELKKQQYCYISTSKSNVIIPGSFVIISYNNTMYLVDGQHRYELIKQMMQDGINLDNTYITLEVYSCASESGQAYAIFNMVNSRYGANGIVVDDSVPLILEEMLKRFPKQCKYNGNTATYAPYCNLDTLSRAIKDSDILRRLDVNKVLEYIDKYNVEYGKFLFNHDTTHYTKCNTKSGFYLPYKGANCSWFKDMIKYYCI